MVSAHVSLETHDGQPLAGTAVTDENGAFEVPVAEARYGLRVVAVGGSTARRGAISGVLSAYVEPFVADIKVPLTPVDCANSMGALLRKLRRASLIISSSSPAAPLGQMTFDRPARCIGRVAFYEQLRNWCRCSELRTVLRSDLGSCEPPGRGGRWFFPCASSRDDRACRPGRRWLRTYPAQRHRRRLCVHS